MFLSLSVVFPTFVNVIFPFFTRDRGLFHLLLLPIVVFPWGGLPFACRRWCAVGNRPELLSSPGTFIMFFGGGIGAGFFYTP